MELKNMSYLIAFKYFNINEGQEDTQDRQKRKPEEVSRAKS
jgi:hypothetical protein